MQSVVHTIKISLNGIVFVVVLYCFLLLIVSLLSSVVFGQQTCWLDTHGGFIWLSRGNLLYIVLTSGPDSIMHSVLVIGAGWDGVVVRGPEVGCVGRGWVLYKLVDMVQPCLVLADFCSQAELFRNKEGRAVELFHDFVRQYSVVVFTKTNIVVLSRVITRPVFLVEINCLLNSHLHNILTSWFFKSLVNCQLFGNTKGRVEKIVEFS